MKNKLLWFLLILISVDTQTKNEELYAGATLAGVLVTGFVVWRATAPSDEFVIQDIDNCMYHENLIKYEQIFQLKSKVDQQEQELLQNLYKLNYDQYQDFSTIQNNVRDDAHKFDILSGSIWFRSFFNVQVSKKYQELQLCYFQVKNLKIYLNQHANFFKGWGLCKEYKDLFTKINLDGDAISSIRKLYLFDNYPLLVFSAKLLKDILWIKNFKKDVYPILDNELANLFNYVSDIVVYVKNHDEYDKEKQRKYQDDEEQRKQDIVDAQLMIAQAAADQAKTIAINAQTERERLELEKQQNERACIQARVEELRRYGYSDQEIQRKLDFEGFTKALINWACGNK